MASVSLFIVSTIVLFGLLLLFPKREERINAAEWSIVMLISVFGIWAFLAGCISHFGASINLWSLSIINMLISLLLIVYIIKTKKIQKLYVPLQDIIVLVVLLAGVIYIGLYRFGGALNIFAYESDDSVRHFYNAKYLTMSGAIGNKRYVMDLLDMVFISVIKGITGNIQYSAFLAADVFLLFLLGAMFWTMLRRFIKNKFHFVCALLLTVFYVLGYPLNNMLHGFEYLGMGILMISFLIWIIWENEYLRIPVGMFCAWLCIANTGIFLSYTQFAPAVLLGELGYLVFSLSEKKNRRPLSFLLTIVAGIGVPGILCVMNIVPSVWSKLQWLVFGALFIALLLAGIIAGILLKKAGKKKLTLKEEYVRMLHAIAKKKELLIFGLVLLVAVLGILAYKYIYIGMMVHYAADGLTLDGSIYREPYANFLLLLYPVCVYAGDCVRKKRNDVVCWMIVGALLESAWLIRYIMVGVIGTYYLYKMSYLIWLLLIACVARIVMIVSGERLKMLRTYLIIVLLFAISTMSGWENKLTQKNRYLWPESVSNRIFGIYEYNLKLLKSGGNVTPDMQDIYNKIDEMVLATGEHIPYFGDDARHRREYYYYLTDQNPDWYYQRWNQEEAVDDIMEILREEQIRHIFVAYDYDGFYMDELLNLEGIYSTEYGRIVELRYEK